MIKKIKKEGKSSEKLPHLPFKYFFISRPNVKRNKILNVIKRMSGGFGNYGKNIFDIYFLLLISNKEVMASSLPLRSNFLDLPNLLPNKQKKLKWSDKVVLWNHL